MTIEIFTKFLGWSALINFGLLTAWFFVLVYAHDWVYQLHCKWFKISVERFDAIHYAGMAFYKISIYMFYFIPFLVLLIVT